jgi:hypothetical protein
VEKKWFVFSNDIVSGPFSTENLKDSLNSRQLNANCFVWWKGQREWMSLQTWQQQLEQIIKLENEKSLSPVWYVESGHAAVGPMTQDEMIENLKSLTNLSRVRLWTTGLAKWTNVFEMHDIMDQMGLSRRENERAPLMGTVAICRIGEEAQPVLARAASISVGGIGLNEAVFLQKGEQVNLLVKSAEFTAPLRIHAIVVYVTAKGYAGLRFENPHPETQSLIFDYVKKFNLNLPEAQSA